MGALLRAKLCTWPACFVRLYRVDQSSSSYVISGAAAPSPHDTVCGRAGGQGRWAGIAGNMVGFRVEKEATLLLFCIGGEITMFFIAATINL